MGKKEVLKLLNQIWYEETHKYPIWKRRCCFCGKKSNKETWMFHHIKNHLKECLPICEECGTQHIPDEWNDFEETLDGHTEWVEV